MRWNTRIASSNARHEGRARRQAVLLGSRLGWYVMKLDNRLKRVIKVICVAACLFQTSTLGDVAPAKAELSSVPKLVGIPNDTINKKRLLATPKISSYTRDGGERWVGLREPLKNMYENIEWQRVFFHRNSPMETAGIIGTRENIFGRIPLDRGNASVNWLLRQFVSDVEPDAASIHESRDVPVIPNLSSYVKVSRFDMFGLIRAKYQVLSGCDIGLWIAGGYLSAELSNGKGRREIDAREATLNSSLIPGLDGLSLRRVGTLPSSSEFGKESTGANYANEERGGGDINSDSSTGCLVLGRFSLPCHLLQILSLIAILFGFVWAILAARWWPSSRAGAHAIGVILCAGGLGFLFCAFFFP
jgi:hypothetical protein